MRLHEYEQAIAQFESLGNQSDKAEYRQGRANAYNWLGLTLTLVPDRAADAEKAYNSALDDPGRTRARESIE